MIFSYGFPTGEISIDLSLHLSILSIHLSVFKLNDLWIFYNLRWNSHIIAILLDDFSRNCKKKGKRNELLWENQCDQIRESLQLLGRYLPKSHTYTYLKDQFNYCKNPFGDDKKPWCYSGTTWDYCDIPMCYW